MDRGTLLTLYGSTDGSATVGTVSLNSDWFESAVKYIRLDKGISAKVWDVEVSKGPLTLLIKYTQDVTAGTVTWNTAKAVHLVSAGHLDIDRRRPLIVISGRSGNEALAFTWQQDTATVSHISALVEFAPIEQ